MTNLLTMTKGLACSRALLSAQPHKLGMKEKSDETVWTHIVLWYKIVVLL